MAKSRISRRSILFLSVLVVLFCLYTTLLYNTQEHRGQFSIQRSIPKRLYFHRSYLNATWASQPIKSCHGGQLINEFLVNEDLLWIRAELDECVRIFYNRVPKSASRGIIRALNLSGVSQRATFVSEKRLNKAKNFFSNAEQLVSFLQYYHDGPTPMLYAQHMHYINFTEYNLSQPLYINVIRDPAARVISHYYYHYHGSLNLPINKTSNYSNLDECITALGRSCYRPYTNVVLPFFCGHSAQCRARSYSVRNRAFHTVQNDYLLVGLTEDLPAFFEVLEALYPNFFAHSKKSYYQTAQQTKRKFTTYEKTGLSHINHLRLKDSLRMEYQFYNFVKTRFYQILSTVRRAKLKLNVTDIRS